MRLTTIFALTVLLSTGLVHTAQPTEQVLEIFKFMDGGSGPFEDYTDTTYAWGYLIRHCCPDDRLYWVATVDTFGRIVLIIMDDMALADDLATYPKSWEASRVDMKFTIVHTNEVLSGIDLLDQDKVTQALGRVWKQLDQTIKEGKIEEVPKRE